MRLKDYFLGIPVRLSSPHSPQTIAERINAAAGSPLWIFNTGVVGRIRGRRVRLRFVDSIAEYNAKPLLAGRVEEGLSGSVLTLRYRAPAWAYVFDALWYSFLTLFGIAALASGLDPDPDLNAGSIALLCLAYLLFFLIPLGMHYFGTRRSDEELGYLLDFLAEQADARP
ncbi:MAG TPA: hypothetical protein VF079_04085 [Sphingomicrobium sp.]